MTQSVDPTSRSGKGWDYVSDGDPTYLKQLEEMATEIINRPDFTVRVLARWNPDALGVWIYRDNGRGASPRLEGLNVAFYRFNTAGTTEELVKAAARYLSTAEVQEIQECVESPFVLLRDVMEVN